MNSRTKQAPRFDAIDGESGAILFRAPASILSECSAQGDVTGAVEFLEWSPAIEWVAPLATLREFLARGGGWTREELASADDETIRQRALWVGACDFRETMRDRAAEWRREAKLGGPGLDSYIYCADVLCVDCAAEEIDSIARAAVDDCDPERLATEDSDSVPIPSFFSESDSVSYCSNCGERLDVSLTSYGVESARESIAEAIAQGRAESIEELGSAIDLSAETIERAQRRAEWNARRRAALLARSPLLPFIGAPRNSAERAP